MPGRAETTRLALTVGGVAFEDVRVTAQVGGDQEERGTERGRRRRQQQQQQQQQQ